MQAGHAKKYASLAAGVFFLGGIGYLAYSGVITASGVKRMASESEQYLKNAGPTGMLIFVLLDIALIVACQPGSFFMELFAGYIYGVYFGVCLILAAKMTAAGICFFLGKFIFAEVVNSMLKKNTTFKNIKAQSGKSGFTLVLGLRLSPVPSYLCSYGASVMNVPFTAYMQATAACTWFMVVNNVYIGQAAGDLTDLMSGKSSGGIADYAKIALPLVGTVVLCDWIRRFMKSLTAKGTPKKPVPGIASDISSENIITSRRTVVTPKKTPTRAAARPSGGARAKSPRGRSPAGRK